MTTKKKEKSYAEKQQDNYNSSPGWATYSGRNGRLPFTGAPWVN